MIYIMSFLMPLTCICYYKPSRAPTQAPACQDTPADTESCVWLWGWSDCACPTTRYRRALQHRSVCSRLLRSMTTTCHRQAAVLSVCYSDV